MLALSEKCTVHLGTQLSVGQNLLLISLQPTVAQPSLHQIAVQQQATSTLSMVLL